MRLEACTWRWIYRPKQPLACLLLIMLYSVALVCFFTLVPSVTPSLDTPMKHITEATRLVVRIISPTLMPSQRSEGISVGEITLPTRRDAGHSLTTQGKQVTMKSGSAILYNLSSCFEPTTWKQDTDMACLQNIGLKRSFNCQHLMKIGHVVGRTGNQLFAVAALYATAIRHGYTAVIESSMPLAEWFNLPNYSNLQLCDCIPMQTFTLGHCCRFDKRVTNLSHATHWKFDGAFQSWRFFEGAEDIVRNAFKIKDRFSTAARKFIDATVPPGTQTICIHVRRGDFVYYEKKGLTVAPVGYIKNATDYFRNRYKSVHFFVISIDIKWCRQNLKWDNITISPFRTVGHDMALMIESDHVIVTSGSFGWWGGWLSGGEVVYWRGFPGRGSIMAAQFNLSEYYPPHWVGLW